MQLCKQRRVVLVNDFVAGQMFALHCDGFVQGVAPDFHRLAGDGEHQVEIQVVETGAPQNIERFEHHLPRVNPAEAFEQRFVE